MKEHYIVHRPIDDNPEIPAAYSHSTAEKLSVPKCQNETKRIRVLLDKTQEGTATASDDHSPTKPIANGEEPFYMLRKKWSLLRRENMITLLGQMYEDDGKEATDAFLLEVIRSF